MFWGTCSFYKMSLSKTSVIIWVVHVRESTQITYLNLNIFYMRCMLFVTLFSFSKVDLHIFLLSNFACTFLVMIEFNH